MEDRVIETKKGAVHYAKNQAAFKFIRIRCIKCSRSTRYISVLLKTPGFGTDLHVREQ